MHLRDMLTILRNTEIRSAPQAIIVFLTLLRTVNSNALISTMLQLNSPKLVTKYSNAVMKAFEANILNTRFGVLANL